MFNVRLFFALCIMSASAALQYAQTQPDSIKSYSIKDEIIISADRFPTYKSETAASISVITRKEIIESGKTSVYDIIRSLPGVETQKSGGPGQVATVMLRGGGSGQTLVLVDGIEMNMVNDPVGTFDFATISLEDVERIEVIRGPQSTLYGSTAMSGVINIITKSAGGNNRLNLSSEYGSYRTFANKLNSAGSINDLSYTISLQQFSSNGFSSADKSFGNTEKDGSNQFGLHGKISYNLPSDFKISLDGKYGKAKTDLDQYGGYFGDDPTYIYNLEEHSIRLSIINKPLSGIFDVSANASIIRNIRKYNFDSSSVYNSSFSHSQYDGIKQKLDLQFNYYWNSLYTASIGIEKEFESATSDYFSRSVWGPYESIFPKSQTASLGLFALQKVTIMDRLHLSVGFRHDTHQQFGEVSTFRITESYIVPEMGVTLKGTYGTGFNSPSLFNLFDPVYGNKELKPEENIGWDVGYEQSLLSEQLQYSVTYFSTEYKNLFGSDAMFRSINIAKAITKGAELELKYINQLFTLSGNYTFLETSDETGTSADYKKPLLRKPKNKASLILQLEPIHGLHCNLEGLYVGNRDDKYFDPINYTSSRLKLSDYTVFNLSATYDVHRVIQVYTRIENVLDKKYEEIYGFGTPGFSLYFGIRIGIE